MIIFRRGTAHARGVRAEHHRRSRRGPQVRKIMPRVSEEIAATFVAVHVHIYMWCPETIGRIDDTG